MSNESDVELIQRSLAEPAAFEVVFSRHFGVVYRFVRRRVGAELADELTSEVFLLAFRGRREFDQERRSALPWLYGIAANLVRMHFRAEQRRLRAYAREAVRAPAMDGISEDTDARLDAAALGARLADALADLSPSLRDALLLHAWAELSHEEIGEAVGCSAGAVRVRVSRARQLVQRHLHEHEETIAS